MGTVGGQTCPEVTFGHGPTKQGRKQRTFGGPDLQDGEQKGQRLRVWTLGRATAHEGRGDVGRSGGPGEGQHHSGRTWKPEKPRSVVI